MKINREKLYFLIITFENYNDYEPFKKLAIFIKNDYI